VGIGFSILEGLVGGKINNAQHSTLKFERGIWGVERAEGWAGKFSPGSKLPGLWLGRGKKSAVANAGGSTRLTTGRFDETHRRQAHAAKGLDWETPFDCAQGRSFDLAQGRPFDWAQGNAGNVGVFHYNSALW
jgi:hypothetical protein